MDNRRMYTTTPMTSVTFLLSWGLFCLAQLGESQARRMHLPCCFPHGLWFTAPPPRPHLVLSISIPCSRSFICPTFLGGKNFVLAPFREGWKKWEDKNQSPIMIYPVLQSLRASNYGVLICYLQFIGEEVETSSRLCNQWKEKLSMAFLHYND